jgi:hypothetical protein
MRFLLAYHLGGAPLNTRQILKKRDGGPDLWVEGQASLTTSVDRASRVAAARP